MLQKIPAVYCFSKLNANCHNFSYWGLNSLQKIISPLTAFCPLRSHYFKEFWSETSGLFYLKMFQKFVALISLEYWNLYCKLYRTKLIKAHHIISPDIYFLHIYTRPRLLWAKRAQSFLFQKINGMLKMATHVFMYLNLSVLLRYTNTKSFFQVFTVKIYILLHPKKSCHVLFKGEK